jgi:DNA-binding transcriptional LysR family regulator
MLGTDIDRVLRAFSRSHPDVQIQLKRIRWWNQESAILESAVDVGFLRLPIDASDLQLIPLYTEPIVVALPAAHPLARRKRLGISDLADEPVLVYADASPEWTATWTVDPRPDGSHPPQGPVVRDMEEILEYVKAGRGVIFLPCALAEAYARPEVAYVPVDDITPGQIALAWNPRHRSGFAHEFIETVSAEFDRNGK